MLSSVRRKIEWLSDLTHVGGAVKVSWAEMEASQDSLVEPTCGNGRALRVRVQLGQDGNLGRESEAGSESSECESSTVCGPLASDSRKGVFGVFGTLWIASLCPRVVYCISSPTANTLPFSPGFKCRNCRPSQSSTVIGHRPQHRSFTERNAERVWRCLGGCVGDSTILRVRGAPEGIIMSEGLGCSSFCPMSKVRGRSCSRR
jgi:hypothetical protein